MHLVPCGILFYNRVSLHEMSCRKVFDSGGGDGREHVFDVPGRQLNVASRKRRFHELLVQCRLRGAGWRLRDREAGGAADVAERGSLDRCALIGVHGVRSGKVQTHTRRQWKSQLEPIPIRARVLIAGPESWGTHCFTVCRSGRI